MVDFDNGLPASGTDITGNNANSALISTKEIREESAQSVGSVLIESKEFRGEADFSVTRVVMEKEEAGKNTLFMYYL